MPAIALDPAYLPPKILRLLYSTVKEVKGEAWARVLLGEAPAAASSGWRAFDFGDAEESLADQTCLSCTCEIAGSDAEECLFEFTSGEPAFYLCGECEGDTASFECEKGPSGDGDVCGDVAECGGDEEDPGKEGDE